MDDFDDLDDLLDEYATPLEIYEKSGNDAGHYVAGEWVPDEGTARQVNEPLLPYGSNTTQGMDASVDTGGTIEQYSMYWYSRTPNEAIGTIVKSIEMDRQFKVASASSYTTLSHITVYGLEAVTSNGQPL